MSRLALIALPVLLVGAAGAVWIALNQPIRAVRVEGALTAGEQRAIREAVPHSLDKPLLSLDLEQVTQQIHSLSWPRNVSVRRIWPATLLINVEKELAVAKWGSGGFLTSDARIVQLPQGDDSLPTFECHLSPPKVAMESFHRLQELLGDHDLAIATLVESETGQWRVDLDNGIGITLGNERLLARMRRFTEVYERALKPRITSVEHIDARYANGVAVRWRTARLAALK